MVLIDQYSKNYISDIFLLSNFDFIKVNDFFNLTYVKNDGAAFSLMANGGYLQRYFLLFVSISVSIFIVFWMHKTKINKRLILFAQATLLAGAVGNMIDRLLYLEVIDFIELHYEDFYWPVFNLADTFIFIGVVLLIFNFKKIDD